jgi:hypothetical protein
MSPMAHPVSIGLTGGSVKKSFVRSLKWVGVQTNRREFCSSLKYRVIKLVEWLRVWVISECIGDCHAGVGW